MKVETTSRPEINSANTTETSAEEKFQNEILRPILKMKNDILIDLGKGNKHLMKLIHISKNEMDFINQCTQFLKSQADIKNQVIGIVLGNLTMKEWDVYSSNSKEYNKRIIQMVGQRMGGAIFQK